MIEISEDTINRVETILAGVPKGAQRAVSNAINRGLSKIKTGAKKRVKEVYTVQSSAFNSATNTRVQRASAGNLAGYISFSGCKIPLYKFKVTPKTPGIRKRVHAAVMKDGGTVFEDAFIAQMPNGHLGIFERETSRRFPIKEFMGLSAAQMIGNIKVMEQLEEDAQKLVDERLEHEIDRLLNSYRG